MLYYPLTFIMRPSESFRWRIDVKFDQRGFSYDYIDSRYPNGFKTLLFITEVMVRYSDLPAMPVVMQELTLRHHAHVFPELRK